MVTGRDIGKVGIGVAIGVASDEAFRYLRRGRIPSEPKEIAREVEVIEIRGAVVTRLEPVFLYRYPSPNVNMTLWAYVIPPGVEGAGDVELVVTINAAPEFVSLECGSMSNQRVDIIFRGVRRTMPPNIPSEDVGLGYTLIHVPR